VLLLVLLLAVRLLLRLLLLRLLLQLLLLNLFIYILRRNSCAVPKRLREVTVTTPSSSSGS